VAVRPRSSQYRKEALWTLTSCQTPCEQGFPTIHLPIRKLWPTPSILRKFWNLGETHERRTLHEVDTANSQAFLLAMWCRPRRRGLRRRTSLRGPPQQQTRRLQRGGATGHSQLEQDPTTTSKEHMPTVQLRCIGICPWRRWSPDAERGCADCATAGRVSATPQTG